MTYKYADISTYQHIRTYEEIPERSIRQDIETDTVHRDILDISDIRTSGQADKQTTGHQDRDRASPRYPGTLS